MHHLPIWLFGVFGYIYLRDKHMDKVISNLLVFLIDQPGRERDALKAILTSMKDVREIELLDNFKALQNWLGRLYPDVVVIRERSGDFYWKSNIKAIKASNPNLRFLIIAETSDQVTDMVEAGADHVFLKGFSSIELYNLLDQWSMEKIIHYFADEPGKAYISKQSSRLQLLV